MKGFSRRSVQAFLSERILLNVGKDGNPCCRKGMSKIMSAYNLAEGVQYKESPLSEKEGRDRFRKLLISHVEKLLKNEGFGDEQPFITAEYKGREYEAFPVKITFKENTDARDD